MKRLIIASSDRTLTIRVNPIEKMVTVIEDLEGELETTSLSFDEAYQAFNLIIDSMKLVAVS